MPEPCEFDPEANEASVKAVTTLWEILLTTNWSFWSLLWLLFFALYILVCCIPCEILGVAYLYYQRHKEGAVREDQADGTAQDEGAEERLRDGLLESAK